MIHSDDLERNINKNEMAIQELAISLESLNLQVDDLLNELEVSAEQLSAFVENKENFSEENWKHLLKQKKDWNEKLQLSLDNIRNPLKAKKKYAERKVEQHWLFVR
jgi:hypothetical protein